MSAKNGRPTAEMILPQHETNATCPECNPPAFPVPNLNDGMTLRDYFAAAAIQGVAERPMGNAIRVNIALQAYKLADAMLEMRGV